MATLILTAVGTAIGGPIGGAIGAFLGQQADSAIFGNGSYEGARLKELAVTTSSYGQSLPRHFGRMRVAGTIIWSTDLIETSSKEGGGKGRPSTTTHSYSASFAVALSSTPIDRIGKIWADGKLLRGLGGDLKVGGTMRLYKGFGDTPPDPLIVAEKGVEAPAFRDCAYVVLEDLQLGDFGNRIPALTFEIFAPKDNSVSLGDLVPQSEKTSGEVLLGNARGLSDEGGPVGSTLAAIDRVYPLSCVSSEDGLIFSSTITLPENVPTLPEQLSTQDSERADERFKQRGETVGKEPLALRYYDEGRDYQPSIQRALGSRHAGRESVIDLPAAMSSDGARQLANANAHRSRWHDEQIVWRIGKLDPSIGPGDVVRLPSTSGFWLVKSWEWFDRGIELNLQRVAPELGAAVASDAGEANTPNDILIPETILHAIEVPPSDPSFVANPILLAAATAAGPGWRGCSLYVEQGNSLAPVGTASANRALTGALTQSLGPSSCSVIEADASLEVELFSNDLTFANTDVTGLAMGENRLLIADEVIQFLEATSMGLGRWKLSGLLRGRAGTEDAAQATHDIGSTVILLDKRLTNLDPALVPSSDVTRVGAIGLGDDTPVYSVLQNAGLSQRPPMPVWPRSTVGLDGSLELCWTRRARGQWRWGSTHEIPLVEEQESYVVGFGPVDAPYNAWSVNSPQIVLSATQLTEMLTTHGGGSIWVFQKGTYSQSSALHLVTLT